MLCSNDDATEIRCIKDCDFPRHCHLQRDHGDSVANCSKGTAVPGDFPSSQQAAAHRRCQGRRRSHTSNGGLAAESRSVGRKLLLSRSRNARSPPLAVQMVSGTAPWIPSILANVVSGIDSSVSMGAAIAALGLWALVPAATGLATVTRRDVV